MASRLPAFEVTMRSALRLASFLLAVVVPLAAHADPVFFTFTANGGQFGGFSGRLTTTALANGTYSITNITGQGITGLLAPGGFDQNDNLLFASGNSPMGDYLDGNGFAFGDVMGNTAFMVNIASLQNGTYAARVTDSDQFSTTVPLDLTLTASAVPTVTPEPSSLILLGTGALAMLGLARRRFAAA